MRTRVTLILAAVLALAATPVLAQEEASPEASVAPPSVEPAAEAPDLTVEDSPTADLWVAFDGALTRVDGQDGSIIEQRLVGDFGCDTSSAMPQFPGLIDDEVWLLGAASPKPAAARCAVRIPVDGTEPSVFWVTPKAKRQLQAFGRWTPIPLEEGALVVAADTKRGQQGWSGDDSNLYRVSSDPSAPAELLQKRVSAGVSSGHGLLGVYREKKAKKAWRTRLGVFDEEAGRLVTPAWLKGVDAFSLYAGPAGLVGGVTHSRLPAVVIDTATQTVTSVKSPEKGSNVEYAMPTPDGTWLGSGKGSKQFFHWVPADGAKAVSVDPCAGTEFGKECGWYFAGWTDDATWFLAGPRDRDYQWDYDRSVLRRYRFGETESSLDVPFAEVSSQEAAED